MFWGLVLEPFKKYTQKVDQSFHISQAALDLTSCNQSQDTAQLVVEYENSNFILATLSKKANVFQVPLDLIFKTGDQISFRVIGSGKVHLSGYHVLEDLDNMIMNGEEESDLDEIDIEEEKKKRKKSTPKSKGGKRAKVDDANEEESDEDFLFAEDDDESSDDDDDEEENKRVADKKAKKKKKNDGEELDIEEEEDEDEEDEEEDFDLDEDDENEDDEDDDEEEEDDEDEDDSEEEQKTPKPGKKKNSETLNGFPTSTKGNKSEQKLNKSGKDIILGTPKKTPQKDLKMKNENTSKNADREATPKGKKNDFSKATDKSPKSEGSPQKKVLEGGVIAEELKVGNGPVAKPGKMANVYYVGTLSTTKKQFDAVQNGPGFKFRIGRNEVIKGWDIGLNGMKVGGKRRLTIPPHLAYGSKGSPPVIPPNSTLVFTVELKGLS